MRRLYILAVLVALSCCEALAAPYIYYRGILNAASFSAQGLPNGPIARGSIFTIFGRDLGPAEGVSVSRFPLGNELAGVSIEVCRGASCTPAIPLFVRSDQINAVLPSGQPLGRSAVRVTFNGEPGNFSPIEVVESNLAIFTARGVGFGPGIVQNFISDGEQPINSNRDVASRGQVVTLWGTGLGPGLGPDREPPQAGSLPVEVDVFVGGVRAERLLYAGRSPCCAGVDQLVFALPAAAPSGCFVPLHVRTNRNHVSNSVTIAIGNDGSCADSHNAFEPLLTRGGRLAAAVAESLTIFADVDPAPPTTYKDDEAALIFRDEPGGPFGFDPKFSLPPVGACTTYGFQGDYLRSSLPTPDTGVRWLDGGPAATVTAGSQSVQLQRNPQQPGFIGGAAGGFRASVEAFFASAASVVIESLGGDDVGPVRASLAVEPALEWSNRGQLSAITRGSPFTLEWAAPGRNGRVAVVAAASVDVTHNVSGLVLCLADPAAGQFTVPGWATANLPAAARRLGESDAALYLGLGASLGESALDAAGVDKRIAWSLGWTAATIEVREGQP